MDVKRYLEKLGYKPLPGSWYAKIKNWLAWYSGEASFHKYAVYNGERRVDCRRKSLGMAKKVCEDRADLLLNEKVTIHVTPKGQKGEIAEEDNATQMFLDDVLEINNFWVRGNQLVELAGATGTGALVVGLKNGIVSIDYVSAPFIWPLSWENGKITECAFVSDRAQGGQKQVYINLHRLEGESYVVENHLFDANGAELPLPEGVEPVWSTGSPSPLFQIITPNIVNNVNITEDENATCPMGISIFANSLDVLEGIDLVYDSYDNEFQLGKKRIFVNDSLVKPEKGKDGKPIPIFDPNDTVFYKIPLGSDNQSTQEAIHESNMELRAEQHEKALQSRLDILSSKCGFGKGYYKFDTDNVQTATGVISQNSQLYRKIQKDEIILKAALIGMVRAILLLGGHSPGGVDISINFDDSIIEDTNAIARRALLEFQAGIIDQAEYLKRVYGYTEKAAQALVETMKNRSPQDEPPDPFDGMMTHADA